MKIDEGKHCSKLDSLIKLVRCPIEKAVNSLSSFPAFTLVNWSKKASFQENTVYQVWKDWSVPDACNWSQNKVFYLGPFCLFSRHLESVCIQLCFSYGVYFYCLRICCLGYRCGCLQLCLASTVLQPNQQELYYTKPRVTEHIEVTSFTMRPTSLKFFTPGPCVTQLTAPTNL